MKTSPLRQRMLDAMQLRGFAPKTIHSYQYAVERLSRHYHCSPDQISPQSIQDWFLYLVQERCLSPSSCRLIFNGLRFFYIEVLHDSAFAAFEFVLPKRKQRIPDLLTRFEVARLLAAPSEHMKRLMLRTCYGCGLRVSERVDIRLQDIDGERQLLHVADAKGGKDRLVPIPASLLQQWRAYWCRYHPSDWLFPSRGEGGKERGALSISVLQKCYTCAKRELGLQKQGGIHALRHAFATHALEAGMPIHQVQSVLGHGHVQTTMRYLHWLPHQSVDGDVLDLLVRLPEVSS